jgi:hypothetical protein
MGAVFEAEATSGATGKLAVKLAAGSVERRLSVERYRIEATFMDGVCRVAPHPADVTDPIPAVLDRIGLGVADVGLVGIVLPLVNFPTLARHVKDHGPLDAAQTARLGASLMLKLEMLERQQVVHCDISPDNLFYDHQTGHVRLFDFGSARTSAEKMATETQQLRALDWQRDLEGKLDFLPPEVTEPDPVTCIADLHSAASTLWWACTGIVPFPAERNVPPEMAAVRRATRIDAGEDPRGAAKVAPPLRDLLMEMLRFDADKRPRAEDVRRRLVALGPALALDVARRSAKALAAVATARVFPALQVQREVGDLLALVETATSAEEFRAPMARVEAMLDTLPIVDRVKAGGGEGAASELVRVQGLLAEANERAVAERAAADQLRAEYAAARARADAAQSAAERRRTIALFGALIAIVAVVVVAVGATATVLFARQATPLPLAETAHSASNPDVAQQQPEDPDATPPGEQVAPTGDVPPVVTATAETPEAPPRGARAPIPEPKDADPQAAAPVGSKSPTAGEPAPPDGTAVLTAKWFVVSVGDPFDVYLGESKVGTTPVQILLEVPSRPTLTFRSPDGSTMTKKERVAVEDPMVIRADLKANTYVLSAKD